MPKKHTAVRGKPTERQDEVLRFMRHYQAENSAPPTLREISKHFKWASVNSALEHLRLLQAKGLVQYHGRKSRSWVAL